VIPILFKFVEVRNNIVLAFIIASSFVVISAFEENNRHDSLELHIDMKASVTAIAKVYYNTGKGFNEKDTSLYKIRGDRQYQTLYFSVPQKQVFNIRFDPLDRDGKITIRKVSLFFGKNKRVQPIGLQAFYPLNEIKTIKLEEKVLNVETEKNILDPSLGLKIKYPVSVTSIYPYRRRLVEYLLYNYHLLMKGFIVVFLITSLAVGFAEFEINRD